MCLCVCIYVFIYIYIYAGLNDKIVILRKTTLQLYFKTFIEKINSGNLGLFRRVGWRRVLLPHPGSATGRLIAPGDHHTLQHIQVHFGVDFQADFQDVRWHDVALT